MSTQLVKFIRAVGLAIAMMGMLLMLWVPSQPWVKLRLRAPLVGTVYEIWVSGNELLQILDGLTGLGALLQRSAQSSIDLGIVRLNILDLVLSNADSSVGSDLQTAIIATRGLAFFTTFTRLSLVAVPLAGLAFIVVVARSLPTANRRRIAALLFLYCTSASIMLVVLMALVGGSVNALMEQNVSLGLLEDMWRGMGIVQVNGTAALGYAILAGFMAVGGSALYMVALGFLRQPVASSATGFAFSAVSNQQPRTEVAAVDYRVAQSPPPQEQLPDEAWAPQKTAIASSPTHTDMEETRLCWQCQRQISSHAIYCRYCGTRQGVRSD